MLRFQTTTAVFIAVGLASLASRRAHARENAPPRSAGLAVPVAMAWDSNGRLHVAARDGRSVYSIDPQKWQVLNRVGVHIQPTSIVAIDPTRLLLGGADGELCWLDLDGRRPEAIVRVGRGATRVLLLPNGRVAVGSVWDRTVQILEIDSARVVATHSLGHAPGAMAITPSNRLLVADAFRDQVTDLEPGRAGSERVHRLAGANLLGLAISGDGNELLVSHMVPYAPLPVTRANIDWGLILSSKLSAIPLSAFDTRAGNANRLPARRLTLDGSGHGAADPVAVAVSPDGRYVIVALRGAHQALVVDRSLGERTAAGLRPLGDSQRLVTVEVGLCPTAVSFDPTGRYFVTADSMSDTLTVIKLDDLSQVATVRLGSGPTSPTAAQRGELSFHDGRNAMDLWMSCASCHPSGHTTGFNFDTQADGGYGAAKNIPSLLGSPTTPPYNWTGKTATLPAQIHKSLRTTMQGPGLADPRVADILAYLVELPLAAPVDAQTSAPARRGTKVFEARRCQQCHVPPTYTLAAVKDVGLDDGTGHNQKFNPPSLRGVSQSAPYLHDGRAATLHDVVEEHDPLGSGVLSTTDRDDLVAFLRSL
jgi:DNA-binding beta-propeller fold protein YncE